MVRLVRGVACPKCFKIIYTLERGEGQTDWVHHGAPLERDERGAFVRCPECKTQVRHRPNPDVPGFGHEVGS